MALNGKQGWLVTALVVGLVSLTLLIVSVLQLQRVNHFNKTLEQENYNLAAEDASPYGIFAKAWLQQQSGDFDAAIEQYSQIENELDSVFQQHVRYNMATLYMQRSMLVRQAGDNDIAIPLIELAKHQYRQLLRYDPAHWPAKYNLEQALKLVPEIKAEEFPDDVMPERSPEATGSITIDSELP